MVERGHSLEDALTEDQVQNNINVQPSVDEHTPTQPEGWLAGTHICMSFWNHPHKGTNSESELIQEGWLSGTE